MYGKQYQLRLFNTEVQLCISCTLHKPLFNHPSIHQSTLTNVTPALILWRRRCWMVDQSSLSWQGTSSQYRNRASNSISTSMPSMKIDFPSSWGWETKPRNLAAGFHLCGNREFKEGSLHKYQCAILMLPCLHMSRWVKFAIYVGEVWSFNRVRCMGETLLMASLAAESMSVQFAILGALLDEEWELCQGMGKWGGWGWSRFRGSCIFRGSGVSHSRVFTCWITV